MQAEPLVTLQRQDGIALISLNRPDRHNALVPELLADLLGALEHPDSRDARALVIRAEGRSFSTGGDLAGFHAHRASIGDYSHGLVGQLNAAILAIYTHPAPVVCAVHGQVTGGSLGLLLAADHVVMRRGVTITPYYSVVGFSPDGGWTALLPDIIGRQRAIDWLGVNASHDADHCLALGLVHEVVDDDCDAAAIQWAYRIAEKDAGSIARTRRLLNVDGDVLHRRLEAERENFVSQVQTRSALEGIDLFLRRRNHA